MDDPRHQVLDSSDDEQPIGLRIQPRPSTMPHPAKKQARTEPLSDKVKQSEAAMDKHEAKVERLAAELNALKKEISRGNKDKERLLKTKAAPRWGTQEVAWNLQVQKAGEGNVPDFPLSDIIGCDLCQLGNYQRQRMQSFIEQLTTATGGSEQFNEVPDGEYWNLLPPWISGVTIPEAEPGTDYQHSVKLYYLLGKLEIQPPTLMSILTLISQLLSGMPTSTFFLIKAGFKTLWETTLKAQVSKHIRVGKAMLVFAMRELGGSVRARFDCDLDATIHWSIDPFLSPTGCESLAIFDKALDQWDDKGNFKVEGILDQKCRRQVVNLPPSRSTFFHETASNMGWLSKPDDDAFLLVDLTKHTLLMVDKSLVLLKKSDEKPGEMTLQIQGPCYRHPAMPARNVPSELGEWLNHHIIKAGADEE